MMNNQPLVSVIMAYYDNTEHVEESIKSVYSQTYKNWELVVVDDCSPSIEAQNLIKSLQEKYGFNLIRSEKNLGVSKTFGKAFEATKGEYVSIISHDDMYTANKLEHSINLIIKNNLDAIYCNGAIIEKDVKKLKPFNSSEVKKAFSQGQKKVAELTSSKDTIGSLLTQGAVYKRKIFEDLSWMREKFILDDWPFSIKVWRDYKVAYDDEITYLYRVHDNNIHKNYWKWFPARVQTICELIDSDKRPEVLSFMLADIGNASLLNGKYDDALRLASASLVMADTSENVSYAQSIISNAIALSKSADTRIRMKQIKQKLKLIVIRSSFWFRAYRIIIKIFLMFIPIKSIRIKIKKFTKI